MADKNGQQRGIWTRTPAYRRKVSQLLRGRKNGPPSIETRNKIAAGLRKSAKHKAASMALRGQKRSKRICQQISATRKARGLRPSPTPAAKRLARRLGPGWVLEYTINRGVYKLGCWQCDIVNPEFRMVIECDGSSHDNPKQQSQDRKRDRELTALGWSVIRIREERIL